MHIYYGGIVWRDMSARHSQCLADLQLLCAERGIGFTNGTIYGDALVSRARSIAASIFYRSVADVLLTIDSDVLFEAEDAISICEKALNGRDIIGAVYMKRAEAPSIACELPIGAPIVMASDSEPMATRYMGTAFAATSRRVFEAMVPQLPLCHQDHAEPWYPFYQPLIVPDENAGYLYLSEDWAFANRAMSLGFQCWIDPSVRIGHLSTTVLTVEDMLRPPKPAPQVLRLKAREDGLIEVETQTPVGA